MGRLLQRSVSRMKALIVGRRLMNGDTYCWEAFNEWGRLLSGSVYLTTCTFKQK